MFSHMSWHPLRSLRSARLQLLAAHNSDCVQQLGNVQFIAWHSAVSAFIDFCYFHVLSDLGACWGYASSTAPEWLAGMEYNSTQIG